MIRKFLSWLKLWKEVIRVLLLTSWIQVKHKLHGENHPSGFLKVTVEDRISIRWEAKK